MMVGSTHAEMIVQVLADEGTTAIFGYSGGAILPLLPFLAGPSLQWSATVTISWTVGITLLALAVVGLAISLFTGRGAWSGAARMVLIGGGAGLLSWFVGRLLGVAIG